MTWGILMTLDSDLIKMSPKKVDWSCLISQCSHNVHLSETPSLASSRPNARRQLQTLERPNECLWRAERCQNSSQMCNYFTYSRLLLSSLKSSQSLLLCHTLQWLKLLEPSAACLCLTDTDILCIIYIKYVKICIDRGCRWESKTSFMS